MIGRRVWLLLALVPLARPTGAQPQAPPSQAVADAVRAMIAVDDLRRHARAIVEHERPSGSRGENAAIDYIVAELQRAGVPHEVHVFDAYTSDPVSATVEVMGHSIAIDAITMSFSASAEGLTAPVVDVGTLRDLPPIERGTGERVIVAGEVGGTRARPSSAVEGAIALVTGQPRNVPTRILERLGAVGVVFVNPEERLNDLIVTSTWGVPSLRNAHRLPTIPVAQITRSAGDAIRELLRRGSVRLRLTTLVRTGWRPLRLATARIPGASLEAPYVLLGGHIDGWYHGGTDEGASNAAMLEVATAFYSVRRELRRGLVIAWWPGHSNARYAGSTWFADRFHSELRDRGVAYLNIDGVGQMGAVQFGASTTASLEGLARNVIQRQTGQLVSPARPGRNSDQSFNGVGLPLLQLNHSRTAADGGYWWWHTPDDTFDKIDFDVLAFDTGLYVDAITPLLTEAVLPVDLVSEVRDLGAALDRWQAAANGKFDLLSLRNDLMALVDGAERVATALQNSPSVAADVSLIRILRPLYRVLYAPLDPFHPDPGVESRLLPGLAPIDVLTQEPVGTDRYRFAETTLVRERNRIGEALEAAIRETDIVLAALTSR